MGSDRETALVKDTSYYILNGDWRKEYAELIPKGYEACKKFFDEHEAEYKNFWSN